VHGDSPQVETFDLGHHRFRELNTPLDYLRLLGDLDTPQNDSRPHPIHHRWA
jgi:hypothetical protein